MVCGVVGWVDWERDLTRECRVLGAMTSVLAHRGPDTGALWLSARAAFGHRRLTVVDPAGGGQPMRRLRDGRGYVITYNGELYNTPELRRELEARGHAFQGYSDTEALLLAACVRFPRPTTYSGVGSMAALPNAGECRNMVIRERMSLQTGVRSGLSQSSSGWQ